MREVIVATTADSGKGPHYICPANGEFRYDNPIESAFNAPNNSQNFHFACKNGDTGVIQQNIYTFFKVLMSLPKSIVDKIQVFYHTSFI